MIKKKPINYLNNKDMLQEIQNSKMSYCYAVDEKYKQFDIIVDSLAEINDDAIQQARTNRAARLANQGYEQGINQWYDEGGNRNSKPKQADFRVEAEDIPLEDLVFRVMTYEHIPTTPGRKKNPKTESDMHSRLNFPPFKQYAFVDGELREVLRSHWQDGFENGSFCQTQGQLTPRLARMMMKLVERYATRGNWRGYTYNAEMQGAALLQLSEVGLKFNEARSQNPFAYYTATITNSFTRVLNLEKRNQSIRDDILQEGGYLPSFGRQLDDEAAQQRARAEDEERARQELSDRGYNII